jgi:hypothetical protein
MSKREVYKILAEKYDSIYFTEERVVRQIPFDQDELKVLKGLYNFENIENNPAEMTRIKAAGEVETLVKYSDGTFVLMLDDARGTTKHEYSSFPQLCQMMSQPYKANSSLAQLQSPKGPDTPYGVERGGPGKTLEVSAFNKSN